MPDRTELTIRGVVTITDNADPMVTVLVPGPPGMPQQSAWDYVPEWRGKVHQLELADILDHPTVARLLATGPPADATLARYYRRPA